jgi:hypothetical protein
LLLSSATNVSGTVAFTCVGFPANSTCNITPASVALGNTTTISVTVLTGVSSAALSSRPMMNRLGMLWLVALLPVGLLGMRRVRRPGFAALALLGLFAAIGCGAGRTIPLEGGSNSNPTPPPITPAGTYTVVASASNAGLTRSVNLTLTVK